MVLCNLVLTGVAQLTVVEVALHRDQDRTVYGLCLL